MYVAPAGLAGSWIGAPTRCRLLDGLACPRARAPARPRARAHRCPGFLCIRSSCLVPSASQRVLLLGTSLSPGTMNLLDRLTAAPGTAITTRSTFIHSSTLRTHAAPGSRSRLEIRRGIWDFVIIQEQSGSFFQFTEEVNVYFHPPGVHPRDAWMGAPTRCRPLDVFLTRCTSTVSPPPPPPPPPPLSICRDTGNGEGSMTAQSPTIFSPPRWSTTAGSST